jgi:uncharacterized protein (TIGR02391 family)
MTRGRLDRKLLQKIGDKLQKPRQVVNVKVSKKAAKLGISSEAALVLIAKELGIGTAHYQRSLPSMTLEEIRDVLLTGLQTSASSLTTQPRNKSLTKRVARPREILRAAIEYLLSDPELRERCEDLLLASANYDRAVNQATLILEDRIRNKSQPSAQMVGENLVNCVLNADCTKTILQVSTNQDEQRGFTFIIRGIVPAFRNLTHHHITRTFTREEALRVCGFIDVVLRVVDGAKKIR